MVDPVPTEDFVVPTPPSVGTTEAGSHTLASVGAGLELPPDAHGLAGGSRNQNRRWLLIWIHR